jgi:hypothetical protein
MQIFIRRKENDMEKAQGPITMVKGRKCPIFLHLDTIMIMEKLVIRENPHVI